MADTEFDYFTRAELFDKLNVIEERLVNLSIKTEPTTEDAKRAVEVAKTRLETEIEQIKAALKASKDVVAVPPPPVAETVSGAAHNYNAQMVKTMNKTVLFPTVVFTC